MTAPASFGASKEVRHVRKGPRDAALEGASLAFAASVAASRTPLNTRTGQQGALVAATQADSVSKRSFTPGSSSPRHSREFLAHQDSPSERSRSPSIAAAIAAAQAPKTETVQLPTRELIRQFEAGENLLNDGPRTEKELVVKRAERSPIRRNVESNGSENLSQATVKSEHGHARVRGIAISRPTGTESFTAGGDGSSTHMLSIPLGNAHTDQAKEQPSTPKNTLLGAATKAKIDNGYPSGGDSTASPSRTVNVLSTAMRDGDDLAISAKGMRRMSSAADIATAVKSSNAVDDSSLAPTLPYNSLHRSRSPNRIVQHMTGDSLADAIVASNVASSRASAVHIPPIPPRRVHGRDPSSVRQADAFSKTSLVSRTPSPAKRSTPPGRLRQTMRREPSSSSLSDGESRKHKASHMVHKHPNKYQEGSRKRWRNLITGRERRRYEGLWATNKGLHLQRETSLGPEIENSSDALGSQDDVLDLVVRDLWLRSRLPAFVLEEIWNLVDERRVGSLNREEFVVGLWLIDQRLGGRKLPPKVSESVWESVRGIGTRIRLKV